MGTYNSTLNVIFALIGCPLFLFDKIVLLGLAFFLHLPAFSVHYITLLRYRIFQIHSTEQEEWIFLRYFVQ